MLVSVKYIIPYFSHKMWLDMMGIRAIPLATDGRLIPRPDIASELIDTRTRAIVLVSPNNPAGTEYPPETMLAFFELARRNRIALIVDETYLDFQTEETGRHRLFSQAGWESTFVHLYSFSKAYRLTGHRVGAIAASPLLLSQVEKFLDTVAICPNQLAQRAALFGIRELAGCLAQESQEVLFRRTAMTRGFKKRGNWTLLGCGAYFAYARHHARAGSQGVVEDLLRRAGILALPGAIFFPEDHDPLGFDCGVRFAFANTDLDGIGEFFDRLQILD